MYDELKYLLNLRLISSRRNLSPSIVIDFVCFKETKARFWRGTSKDIWA